MPAGVLWRALYASGTCVMAEVHSICAWGCFRDFWSGPGRAARRMHENGCVSAICDQNRAPFPPISPNALPAASFPGDFSVRLDHTVSMRFSTS